MVSARIHAKELDVQHMRQPGNRVPIARMGRTEGPDDAFPAQPLTHKTILGHIFIIVITDKFMRPYLAVNTKDCPNENRTQDDIQPQSGPYIRIDCFYMVSRSQMMRPLTVSIHYQGFVNSRGIITVPFKYHTINSISWGLKLWEKRISVLLSGGFIGLYSPENDGCKHG